MRKIMFIIMAILVMASCTKDNAPESGTSTSDNAVAANPGETIQITVTLPQIKPLETKVALSENDVCGFDLAWEAGDKILVSGETFTLVSADGKRGIFSGKMPAGETFDISYPLEEVTTSAVQKADSDYSHIKYYAELRGVRSLFDIHFSYGWAGAHGGTFVQSGALKLVLNLPVGTGAVNSVTFSGDGFETLSLDIEDGSFAGNTFTAYLSCGEISLDSTREVTVKVTTENNEELVNTFLPCTQTLYEGCLVRLVTSASKWQRKLTGAGSENSPYLINDLAGLQNIKSLISVNTMTYFKLTADIDMSSVKEWTPVNILNEPYGVVFDGGGHKIKGFTCTHGSRGSFFGILHGTVKNLTFEDATVTVSTSSPSGIVAAWVGNIDGTLQGELNNVKVVRGEVSTTASGYVGGLAGRSGAGKFENCSYEGEVISKNASSGSGNYPAGGILGEALDNVSFTGCTFSGTVSTVTGSVGGILGQSNASKGNACVIAKCLTSGTLTATHSAGGIVGRTSNIGVKISDCGSSMNINATMSNIGGIVGDLAKNSTLSHCYSTGNITAAFAIGGIVGRAFGRQDSSASLDNNVNTTVEGCIAWNTSIKTTVSGGENPASHYSGGAVIGCSSRPNTLQNCWRKNDFSFDYYADASLNVLFDHADCSPSAPLVQPSGSAKWFSPYHGKAASAGATLSSVAQSAGWSSEIWDFSGSVPVLK